jgi:alpha-beta hydrolase superfamily lysophospholipase
VLNPFVMTKLMVNARRAPLTRTPADVGLDYEDVSFPAADGVGLKGWFIPSGQETPGPAVVFVHGWMWNRLGNVAHQTKGLKDADVDFLPAAKGLHDAGFGVLLFDVRRHGESESGKGPLSYGPVEARDYIGAVRHLRSRPEVDGERIGAIGTSMGGNIVMYGTPEVQPIKAILAIQPTRLAVFNANFMRTELGPLGPPMVKPMELVYAAMRTPRPGKHDPGVPARELGDTVVQYVQGTGDQWGEMGIVEEFASVTPKVAGPVIKYPSTGRYEGYRYISERADDVVAFFKQHL